VNISSICRKAKINLRIFAEIVFDILRIFQSRTRANGLKIVRFFYGRFLRLASIAFNGPAIKMTFRKKSGGAIKDDEIVAIRTKPTAAKSNQP